MPELESQSIIVYEKAPEDFQPQVHVAACYVEVDSQLLLLQRSPTKSEGGLWGVPAGKIEENELYVNGAKRELFEETGIIAKDKDLEKLRTIYFRKPEIDFVYHLFYVSLSAKPAIQLSSEHSDYLWVSAETCQNLPLMAGAKEALDAYQDALLKKYSSTYVNAYLILRKNDQVLFHIRKNTGYYDGHWCLPAGHVELGESATEGMIREAKEELGIEIAFEDLKVVHIMHRRTNRLNMDIFFECAKWQGDIRNMEPEKCEKIAFFPLTSLPSPLVDYAAFALQAAEDTLFYSERGFTCR